MFGALNFFLTGAKKSGFSVTYLVVAGAGGGGGTANGYAGGGGGGAGGYLSSTFSAALSTAYTVTVGAGGNGGNGSTPAAGTNGSNSVFSSITSTGGGVGGTSASTSFAAASGGSGGGGKYNSSGASASPTGQGNNGGAGNGYGGGGGGGAGAVGANNTATGLSQNGANGGVGLANSISGSSVYYAGGGGSGQYLGTGGLGGTGGGGNGGALGGNNGSNGTANLGGGGGGATDAQTANFNGGNGGSGVVIISIPNTYYPTFTTGVSYTSKVNGSNKVYTVIATSTGSETVTFSTTAPSKPTIGAAYGGGYFAGQINDGGTIYNLVVSDVTVGQTGVGTTKWGTYGVNTGFSSTINGPTNSAGLAALGSAYAAAVFCEAVNSGGYTDWYLPAENELEVCYYFLKPSTGTNNTASGSNSNAVSPEPVSTVYTSGAPAQTSATNFRTGASSQEFTATSGYYWTSTQANAYTGRLQYFLDGQQSNQDTRYAFMCRAIRRVLV